MTCAPAGPSRAFRPRRRRLPGADPQLRRFLDAQAGGVIEGALSELRAGRKTGHWMWFVFPQLRGLGVSPTAEHYGISGVAEARAYAAHPVLGPRLEQCCEALLEAGDGVGARDVLGTVDALKLRSCATLFTRAAAAPELFSQVLDRFYDGVADDATLRLLEREAGPGG